MIWSAFRRPHAANTEDMRNIRRRAARRRGLARADALHRQVEAAITVEIWRWAARMIFHYWPRPREDECEDSRVERLVGRGDERDAQLCGRSSRQPRQLGLRV